ncbi:hypothetical protein DDQ50_02490 [Amnibacterium flavum]|uniref:HTH luxR-type domain-containing protein n=1 Tax=Amnibacterium flavum TaxID=2173173 RepID=A0A2V1HUM8_9MICO|nr:hypothetical protein DDQ50_02490 [Amnibacterium flavum]
MDAVDALIASMLPGGSEVAPAFMDIARRYADALIRGSDETERSRVAAAVVVAHARMGDPAEAARLAESEIAVARAADRLDADRLSLLLSAAAEAFLTPGNVRPGTASALQALSYATLAAQDELVFRAHTLLAVGYALNGQYEEAERSAAACRQLQAAHHWEVSAVFYSLLLGEILIHSSTLDSGELRRITGELRSAEPGNRLWTATADSAEAMALLAINDHATAIPLLMGVLSDANSTGILPMVRGFALGIQADLLLARGEARRVLRVLQGRRSPWSHALCFDMQRSAAYLLLGENRDALLVTDACMKLGPDHCLRTVPPLLFRRAVAHLRLGQGARADEAFEEGFRLILQSGSLTPLLTLAPDEIRGLAQRLGERRPELALQVDDFVRQLTQLPVVDRVRSALPRLSPRESVLASRLRTGDSLVSVAESLSVSHNTVKSQARTLYRKLGVTSRADALDALEGAGFFD